MEHPPALVLGGVGGLHETVTCNRASQCDLIKEEEAKNKQIYERETETANGV